MAPQGLRPFDAVARDGVALRATAAEAHNGRPAETELAQEETWEQNMGKHKILAASNVYPNLTARYTKRTPLF